MYFTLLYTLTTARPTHTILQKENKYTTHLHTPFLLLFRKCRYNYPTGICSSRREAFAQWEMTLMDSISKTRRKAIRHLTWPGLPRLR